MNRTTDEVRKKTEATQCVDGSLSWFCLLFAMHVGNQRHVDKGKVLGSDAELELSHCLDERC